MKTIYLFVLATLLSSLAYAGRITTNPLSSLGDDVISTSIRHSNITQFKVLAKTPLETFSIETKSYSDASALAADLKKNTIVHCKMKDSLRVERISNCKLIEVKFND